MKFRQAFICLSIVFVFLIAGCEKQSAEAPVKMSDVKPDVVVAKAVQQDVQLKTSYTGQLVSEHKVDIVPRIRGILEEVNYKEGMIVTEGQLLYTIEDFDYKNAVDKAKADVEAAQAREVSARATYESAEKSNEKVQGTVSANDITKYLSAWQQAKAELDRSKSQYDYQVRQLSYTQIFAPIQGKITKTNFTHGALLDGTGANPPVLCTIVQMDPIYVEFQVPDKDFDKVLIEASKYNTLKKSGIKDGQPAATPVTQTDVNSLNGEDSPSLNAEVVASENIQTSASADSPNSAALSVAPDNNAENTDDEDKFTDIINFELFLSDAPDAKAYTGVLDYNDPAIDESTGTITIRGELSNSEFELYPGHICTVRLKSALKKDVVVIQSKAIQNDLSAKFVWTVDDKGVASKRYIVVEESFENDAMRILAPYSEEEVTTSNGEKIVKKTGLKPGEPYIVEGFLKVREGMTVNTKQE